MKKDVPKINQGFVNKNGIYFPNIREVAYKNGELYGNLGTLVAQTTRINDDFFKTDFPTGVVTKDGFIIGQEIPFYNQYKTLENYVKEITSYEQLFALYQIAILILEELKECGITYIDVHAKNFMIYKNNTKLIDFEASKIKFDENKYLKDSLLHLRNMLNLLNQKLFISYRFEEFINYQDALKQVEQMRKSLK